MIRLEYEVTPADFEAFNLHVAYRPRNRARWRRQQIAALLIAPLAVPVFSLLFPVKGGYDPVWDIGLTMAVVFLIMLAFIPLSHRLYRWRLRAAVRRMLGRNPRESFLGQQHFEAGPEGVTVAGNGVKASYGWPTIARLDETEAALYLMLGEVQGIILPKRGQDAAVLAALRTLVAASTPAAMQQGAGG